MQQSDLDGVRRNGEIDRMTDMTYFENPFFNISSLTVGTPEQLSDWFAFSSAWASGWLEADGGCDEAIATLMQVRCW